MIWKASVDEHRRPTNNEMIDMIMMMETILLLPGAFALLRCVVIA